ncbi:sensor domain-containing diguanylate cyclase [Pleionea litopenaei]|uniref:Sensor domain-containing diguanylate cyclase n=1 Tax=Pleionea litopenaei TaxID=3070815 RepID=A0AA51RSR7_9GAMM|nr:sensor domain-containing diguanylate cyclase [Pleionea sp. HL-JVS1]WMS86819.1 sensor domain-containing diguanylate cyclase [Pleionea sp. HL-JVS1]
MKEAAPPSNEQHRLNILNSLNILDSDRNERFDRITRLAARVFNVSISLVSLIDKERQWFKSEIGLEAKETSRAVSFCAHAINSDDIMIVEDAQNDERFNDNPLVVNAPFIRFYAGCPLKYRDGTNLGTLCLIDPMPRKFTQDDVQLLHDLAALVENEIAALELATTDDLTQIANRRAFFSVARNIMAAYQEKENTFFSIAFFDLNDFKFINDNLGHEVGDEVLITFAKLLKKSFRACDVVARVGGDEFAVLYAHEKKSQIEAAVSRFNKLIDNFNDARTDYQIKYSVGVVEFSSDENINLDSMLSEADKLMYQNKQHSKCN